MLNEKYTIKFPEGHKHAEQSKLEEFIKNENARSNEYGSNIELLSFVSGEFDSIAIIDFTEGEDCDGDIDVSLYEIMDGQDLSYIKFD